MSITDKCKDSKIPLFFISDFPFDHTQLGLGMIQSYVQHYKNGILKDYYHLMPHILADISQVKKITQAFGPGVWLFSNYVWTVKSSLEISAAIKEIDPRNITIHGGPSTPKYPDANKSFLVSNQQVNFAVMGEGEITAAELLDKLMHFFDNGKGDLDDFNQIMGISYLQNGNVIRTEDRPRIDNLDEIPSPYLTGVYDQLYKKIRAAIIETNRGCPYSCAFCDWGSLTSQIIKLFDLNRVYDELIWIGKHQIPVIAIADANFGIFERDIEIAKKISEIKQEFGYPKEVLVNYAKNATNRLAEIVNIFTRNGITTQGVIAIQTTDGNTLNIINRSNIKTERYVELTDIFRKEGLPLSIDIMLALPGSTFTSFKNDLQRFFDEDIRVKAYHTRLLPNSPMADPEFINKYKIKFDDKDQIQSSNSFTKDDVDRMNSIYMLYLWLTEFAFLKYYLCYLQWDHEIPALNFIDTLLDQILKQPDSISSIDPTELYSYQNKPIKMVAGNWNTFYKEIAQFTLSNYSIDQDSAIETVLIVNESVMPSPDTTYPITINLGHDFVKYYQDHRSNDPERRSLSDYSPNFISIDDPENISKSPLSDFIQYATNQIFWELENPLRRSISKPYYF